MVKSSVFIFSILFASILLLSAETSAIISQTTLTVSKTGSGIVISGDSPQTINCGTTCSATYTSLGTSPTIILTASPSSNYIFVGWSGACTGSGTCSVSMSSGKSVIANFGLYVAPPIEPTISSYVDCGLRVYDGSQIIAIACENGTLTSSLRIRKNSTTTYGIVLVEPNDANASKIRINTSSGVKALRKGVFKDCISSGGLVVDDGAGNKMCKFMSSTCLGGWSQYKNWSTTQANSTAYTNEIVSGTCTLGCIDMATVQLCGTAVATCATSGHAWSNQNVESNTCAGTQSLANEWLTWYTDYGLCRNHIPNVKITACGSYKSCTGATSATVKSNVTEIGCY